MNVICMMCVNWTNHYMFVARNAYFEIPWHFVCELLCILCNLIVQVDVGGVLQQVVLPVHCCHHFRMTVSHTDCHNPSKSL